MDPKHTINLFKGKTVNDFSKFNEVFYYDALTVFPSSPNSFSQNFSYDQTSLKPILSKASDYYLSVIRFNIPGAIIPLFIFDTTKVYKFILSYGGSDASQNLVYVPQNVLTTTDPSYYYVYSYQDMVNMMNTALAAAFAALLVLQPGDPDTDAPYFVYLPEEGSDGRIILVTNSSYATAGHTQIFFSFDLFRFIDGFDLFRNYTQIPLLSGKDFLFIINDNDTNQYQPPTIAPQFPPIWLQQFQEYGVIEKWSTLRSIVFTTTMPIISEYIPTNITSMVNTNIGNTGILTDFTPDLDVPGAQRGLFQYFPTSQYRLISLTGNDPLYRIQFDIFWSDDFGRLYPLIIPNNSNVNVKIAFLKKELSPL